LDATTTTEKRVFPAVRPTTPMGVNAGSGAFKKTTAAIAFIGGGTTSATTSTTMSSATATLSTVDFPRTSLISFASISVILLIAIIVFCVFRCYSRGSRPVDSCSVDSGAGAAKTTYAALPTDTSLYGQTTTRHVNGYQPMIKSTISAASRWKMKDKSVKEWYV